MSDPVQSFFDILAQYKLDLSGIDSSFEEGFVSAELRDQLKNEIKRQFEERKTQLAATLPPVSGHPSSTPSLPPAASPSVGSASDAHVGATPSVPKTRRGYNPAPPAATSVFTTPAAATSVATTPVSSGTSVPGTNPVVPDMDHSPRPKRARNVPVANRDMEAQIKAEKALTERFKWKRIPELRQGHKYKYINPQGNYNDKSVKNEDLKLGEDFFFDAQEALKYAESHDGL